MIVPFCDLARESRAMETDLMNAAERVIRSGRFLYGPELEAFEHELAAWHGVKYAVGVASGTDAVEIALRALGGDAWGDDGTPRIAVTAMTAVPTINAIEAAGWGAVLHDPDPVTRNAPCGMHVQLYGLATSADPYAVEDIAHGMGAMVDGCLAGTMGRVGALSFYPTKLLGACGDGGALITNDKTIADRARQIRHYGMNDDGSVSMRGQNSRLSELQAAFLRVKLPMVHGWIDRRRAIAKRYNDELAGKVRVPVEPEGCRAVYHVYVVETEESHERDLRYQLAARLLGADVQTMIHYPRAIHEHERWRHLGEPGQFPVAERLARTVLSLPCYPFLSDQEVDHVIASVKAST